MVSYPHYLDIFLPFLRFFGHTWYQKSILPLYSYGILWVAQTASSIKIYLGYLGKSAAPLTIPLEHTVPLNSYEPGVSKCINHQHPESSSYSSRRWSTPPYVRLLLPGKKSLEKMWTSPQTDPACKAFSVKLAANNLLVSLQDNMPVKERQSPKLRGLVQLYKVPVECGA